MLKKHGFIPRLSSLPFMFRANIEAFTRFYNPFSMGCFTLDRKQGLTGAYISPSYDIFIQKGVVLYKKALTAIKGISIINVTKEVGGGQSEKSSFIYSSINRRTGARWS